MFKVLVLSFLPLLAIAQPGEFRGTFNDNRDSKEYTWVKIGSQVWMSENLAYETQDGSFAYEYKVENAKSYGMLYTWEAAQGACPDGWHLPEGWEWSELYSNYGRMNNAGGALKSTGFEQWSVPNTGANNRSGFSAIPAGAYSGKLYLTFNSLGKQAYFWTSTEVDEKTARVMQLGYNHAAAYDLGFHPKTWALSVRCIKD